MAVRFEERMIVTTGSEVAGRAIADYLGVVRGLVVWAPTRRQRIRGRADAMLEGGNNRFFLEVAEAAREDAHSEMVKHAKGLGADAVIGTRYQTTPFAAEGVSEVLAYGTAVRLAP
jgi:uncharacterized protein YbjQ (UPF0145 family)